MSCLRHFLGGKCEKGVGGWGGEGVGSYPSSGPDPQEILSVSLTIQETNKMISKQLHFPMILCQPLLLHYTKHICRALLPTELIKNSELSISEQVIIVTNQKHVKSQTDKSLNVIPSILRMSENGRAISWIF